MSNQRSKRVQANRERFPVRPLKRGTVHPNGKIFWRYNLEKKAETIADIEVWMDAETFEVKNTEDQARALSNYQKDPQKSHNQAIAWAKANREKVNSRWRERRKSCPEFAVAMRCRASLQSAIRRKGWKKPGRTLEHLGCDWATLKLHLESLFLKGMTWENRDQWHIDHFHPLSDAKTIEDVLRLSHYTNLRPLWDTDNFKKSDKLPTKGLQIPLLLQ